VLLALQNPTATHLGDTSIKRNLTTRLVGRVDSAQAANVASGLKGSGAELLTGAGDMLLVVPTGVKRMTAALLTERDTDRLPCTEEVSLSPFDYLPGELSGGPTGAQTLAFRYDSGHSRGHSNC
jgi:DNA segregation ATPase FtsK/SpoIIIE-like protein